MKNRVLELIKSYDKIIIHRHLRPDMDAIGSQMGLFHLLKENYPNKEIYVVGDENNWLYKCKMDIIDDNIFKNALSIIIDVAVKALISDDRYKLASDILIIDHHQNETDLDKYTLFYQESSFTSACEILVDLARTFNWKVSKMASTYIYGGMVTDTGRFQFISEEVAPRVFMNASYITQFKPEISELYNFFYTEELAKRKTKLLFSDFEITENGVAYRKNNKELIIKSGLDIFNVSRGMVNLMAGLKEVPIWVSFTEDYENGKILAEIRSRNIIVVDIAKKYGGGGHNFACGASLESFEVADLMLKDLNERAKEHGNNE